MSKDKYDGYNNRTLQRSLIKRDKDIAAATQEMEKRGKDIMLLKKMMEEFGDFITDHEYKQRMQAVFDGFDARNKTGRH